MTLLNRVSMFFLLALAVVLMVYSATFYLLVRSQLVEQFEQELLGALNSLVAAVEIEPEEVKWQPLEHTIALGGSIATDQVRWVVIGDKERVVEASQNSTPGLIARAKQIAAAAVDETIHESADPVGEQRFVYQRLVAPAPDHSQRELDEFDEVAVVVARSTQPLWSDLRRLSLLVCALPLGTWLVAAATGRWFCRRALQPVLDMSAQATKMTGAGFQSRLPVSATKDELAELATAFNSLLDSQHQAFEQQRRFTGNAAHELRTPLTVLLGQIDVSLRRPRSSEEYAATLRVLRDQTAELQTIVESLLFLARAEEDAVPLDAETLLLADWLSEVVQRWAEHPRAEDLHLQVSENRSLRVTASRALLTRLLDNLIENALKYSEPGSAVEIIADRDGEHAIVTVKDHGIGIAVEDLQAIFTPFYRARSARDAGVAGTGLGLAIVARIARACGGRLHCSSEVGRGTRFTLCLPAARD